MSAEFDKLILGLMKNGYGPAAHKTAALRVELEEKGMIPDSLHDGNCMLPEETFGQWLTRLTIARKMKQRQLARRAGVDNSSISRILREDRIPTLPIFTRIIVALSISPETAFKVMEDVSNKELEKKS
jgi:DNA-binding Xre family transcriptional regulator